MGELISRKQKSITNIYAAIDGQKENISWAFEYKSQEIAKFLTDILQS
jgi:hypothetical protein